MRFWRFAIPIVRPEKRIITRRLQLQATVKRFLFDLHLHLEYLHIHSLVCGFKDKSLRTDMVNQTSESTGKSPNFHVFWS